ncbi:MAG: adenylate/guanylate cyclase domain-containing protein [Candidatus Sumerlaeota bacterium]
MANLLVQTKNRRDKKYDLGEMSDIHVGRERNNTVIIGDPRVSRHHLRITREGGDYWVENLSRTQATELNGEGIEKARLGDGDMLEIGNSRLIFHIGKTDDLESQTLQPQKPVSNLKYGETAEATCVVDAFDPQTTASPPREVSPGGGGDPSHSIMIAPDEGDGVPNMMATSDPKQASVHSALESMVAGQKALRLRERFMLLQDISQEMVSELRLDKLLKYILDKTFSVLNVDNGLILLVEPETRQLAPRAVRLRKERRQKADRLRVSQTVLREAYQKKIGVLYVDVDNDSQFGHQESIVAFGMRSVMCVPLILHDEVLGLIHLDNETRHSAFSREDLDFLTMLAGQAALAVHNARLHDQIVHEETMRSHLERYFSPAIASKIASNEIQLDRVGRSVEATVLYSDIRNFTSLSEGADPEELVEFLNMYFAAMADLVFEYDGTLDKYVGDALVAVFGSPIPDPEGPLKAARCTLEMVQTVRDMDFAMGKISIGIGLHHGRVVHGNVGSEKVMQYTVIGDTVNTAARLSDKAAPHQVVISSVVREALGDDMHVRALGKMNLKGKSLPLETFELVDE